MTVEKTPFHARFCAVRVGSKRWTRSLGEFLKGPDLVWSGSFGF